MRLGHVLSAALTGAVLLTAAAGCGPSSGTSSGPSTGPAVRSQETTPSSSPSQASRVVPPPLHRSRAFAMLPPGAAPRVAYVYGDHWLEVQGSPARALPGRLRQVLALTPLTYGGWLVSSRVGADGSGSGMGTDGFAPVTRLTESLSPRWTRSGAAGFGAATIPSAMTGTAGSLAYFTVPDRPEPRGRLTLLAFDGKERRTWLVPFQQVAVPEGITGAGAVVFERTTAVGNPQGAWVTGAGERWRRITRLPLHAVYSVHGVLVAGSRRRGCDVVLAGDHELWHTCDGFRLAAFSPDGRYIAAWHTETGGEFETVYVLDARTGAVVTSTAARAPRGFQGLPAGSLAWEDASHLLVTFAVGTVQEIVRMDLQGHLHRTTGALRVHVGETGFVLATQTVPPEGR